MYIVHGGPGISPPPPPHGGRLVPKLHHTLRSIRDSFLFGYGIVFSFRYGLFIWVWYIHCMVVSFGYGVFIQVWCFHLSMVSSFGYGVFIWVWSFHSGNRCVLRITRPTTVREHSLFCRLELYTISAGG